MNRPNIEDYKYANGLKFRPYTEYKMATYIKDLEKYCDELEHELKEFRRADSWDRGARSMSIDDAYYWYK